MGKQEAKTCLFPVIARKTAEAGITDACFVFDKAPCHLEAADCWFGEEPTKARAPHAAGSPDMNKIAEHCISDIKQKFFDRLMREGANNLTARRAQRWVQEIFQQVNAESIMQDAVSLVDTMRAIKASKRTIITCQDGSRFNGTAGDWAPRPLR